MNPVLPGFFPDPSVCRAGEKYYVANSTFEYHPGLPIHESDDLVTWRPVGHVLDESLLPFGTMGDSKGLYAPSIRFHDDRFWIACTLVGEDRDRQFFTSAPTAAGPWAPPTWLLDADGFDPSIFFAADGRTWWVASRVLKPGTFFGECVVWVREVDLAAGAFVGEETVIWRGALHGATWCEAPHLFERDGWIVLVAAEGGTFREHAVVAARSRAVDGPYENCPRNPVFTHRQLGRDHPVQNVGHADLVERPDGSWAAVMLAVRTIGDRHVLGRETFVAEVEWEDGWPVVNALTGVLQDVADRPAVRTDAPADLDGAITVRGPATFAAREAGGVRIAATGTGVTDAAAPAALLRRLQHHDATLEVRLTEAAPGTTTGLLLRQSTDHSLRVERTRGLVRVVLRAAGLDEVTAEWPDDREEIAFVAEVRPGAVRLGTLDRLAEPLPIDVLSSEVAGGFVGTTWGPYVEGSAGASALLTATRYEGRVASHDRDRTMEMEPA